MPPVSQIAAPPNPLASQVRHRLLLRDTLTFLALTAITLLLFAITLALFRSFTAHQHALALRWSSRGQADLALGHPDQAITALRTALTFAPGERSYELLLAQALGDAGHTEEAFNYFTGLWDREPGDGLINLRLARLAAARRDPAEAVNFYRAAIYGTWSGDAIPRRLETRLELSRYLLAQHDLHAAREELLIAGGNAGRDSALETRIASLLAQAGDPIDALAYDNRAITDDPRNLAAASDAAHLSEQLGSFTEARADLEHAIHLAESIKPASPSFPELRTLRALRDRIDRLLTLDPESPSLSSADRVTRILADTAIARRRLATCLGETPDSATLTDLNARWSAIPLSSRSLRRNPGQQTAATALVDTTERTAVSSCGPPTGDDALLLRLAQHHTAPQP